MTRKSSASSRSKKSTKTFPIKYNAYPCRVCNRAHPLKTGKKFLAMNITERIREFRNKKYCQNCLAHDSE